MVNVEGLESLSAPKLRQLTRDLIEQLTEQQRTNDENVESLKRELLFASTRVEQLTHELAHYKRLRFERSSERLAAAQASLLEETLDTDLAAIESELEQLRPAPKPLSKPLSLMLGD